MFDDLWDSIIDTWWGRILFGLLFLLLAYLVYWYLSGVEVRGGRVNWFIAIAHYIGGKLCAASCFGVPGVLLIGLGIHSLFGGGRDE